MSGDSFAIIGAATTVAVAAPAVVAGAVVVGTIYSAHRATMRERERRRLEEARRREEERQMTAQIDEMSEQYERLTENFQRQREDVEARAQERLDQLRTELSEQVNTASQETMVDLKRRAEQAQREIMEVWHGEIVEMSNHYAQELRGAFDSIKQKTIHTAQGLANLSADMKAREQALHDRAQYMLDKTRDMLRTLEIESGQDVFRFTSVYNQAAQHFNAQSYALAYNLSSALFVQCADAVRDTLINRASIESTLSQFAARLDNMEGRFEALEKARFTHNGVLYEDDIRRFMPDYFEAFHQRLADLNGRMNGVQTLREIDSLSAELDDLEGDLTELTRQSVERMLMAYVENDSAKYITEALAGQGYLLQDYAYEDNLEGCEMHINYYNSLSQERLTIVLAPENRNIHVEAHQFGDGGTTMDERRQDAINDILSEHLGVRMRCQNRGRTSQRTDAADLQMLRRRTNH